METHCEQRKNKKNLFLSPYWHLCPKGIQQFTGAALVPPGWVEAQIANHLPPKTKILDPSRMHVDLSQWLHETFNSKTVCHQFYLGLMAGAQTVGQNKSISTGAQYVTPSSKIYWEKLKMCRFSSGNWFLCTKFVQLAVAGERRNTVVHLQKRV
jgi:hypothetical protein